MTGEELEAAVAAMADSTVVVAAWLLFDAGSLLVVRPEGVPVWFLPGGLVEPGESLPAAAAREAHEEVGVVVEPADLEPYALVTAEAFGRPGSSVAIACFTGPHAGIPTPLGEIVELAWVTMAERDDCAEAVRLVIDQAVERGHMQRR